MIDGKQKLIKVEKTKTAKQVKYVKEKLNFFKEDQTNYLNELKKWANILITLPDKILEVEPRYEVFRTYIQKRITFLEEELVFAEECTKMVNEFIIDDDLVHLTDASAKCVTICNCLGLPVPREWFDKH